MRHHRQRRAIMSPHSLFLPLLLVLPSGELWLTSDGDGRWGCGMRLTRGALHDDGVEESGAPHFDLPPLPAAGPPPQHQRLFPPTARAPPPRLSSSVRYDAMRFLENDNDDDDDDNRDDDFYKADDDGGDDDDDDADDGDDTDDLLYFVNEKCSEYLISFLEGTTDAKDNCDGLMNAYTSANCAEIEGETPQNYEGQTDDHDDYLDAFYGHECCQSLLTHYYEYCNKPEMLTENNLIIVAFILLVTEFVKSFVKKNNIHFLPEACSCILVGAFIGLLAHLLFGVNVDRISFDEEIFMCILLPPIIFEAALTVNKKEFRRRRGAIFTFAVFGTLFSTFATGAVVHYASLASSTAVTIPTHDALVFGALISSIDPVAILSVLNGLGMAETDTIFILVLGESLLNDGIAITLFKSLREHYINDDEGTTIDKALGSVADFLILLFGSASVALVCGILCIVYFWLNKDLVHPVMEVATFFLWALIPYWVCEYIEWSGIVSIVVMGFFMDVYLSPKPDERETLDDSVGLSHSELSMTESEMYRPPDLDGRQWSRGSICSSLGSPRRVSEAMSLGGGNGRRGDSSPALPAPVINMKKVLLRKQHVQLSPEANQHVRFVAHILAQLAENAIFAYLGLFLFSSNYNWDVVLCSIAIASCILGRTLMVTLASRAVWHFHIVRQWAVSDEVFVTEPRSKSTRALARWRTQAVLVLAGLRGAVSLALVENVPIYNGVTGQGSQFKPEMKAMTSASIMFTMFFFGGGAYYILGWMGVQSEDLRGAKEVPTNIQMKGSALNSKGVTEMYGLERVSSSDNERSTEDSPG